MLPRDNSVRLFDQARKLIPGGVNSPVRAFRHVGGVPVYVRRASGSHITDADGNTFVDFCQSWGPLILGHAHPQVVEAVAEAARGGLSYGACHRREIELAELILTGFPEFDQVRLTSSGTEAVMTALRVARGVTNRPLVLKFEGGYHGHFDGMLVKAGSGLVTQGTPDSLGVPEQIAGTTLVSTLDDEAAVTRLLGEFGERIAAVIIEPLPANNGLLVQRKDFLQFLRDKTRHVGALLIFDEVISGFRLRYGGYGQMVDVQPDLVTLGKIIGGGMPVGAVVGPAGVMGVLAPEGRVYQAGTLSGNPVSLAAGIATLRVLQAEPAYEKLETLGRSFLNRLASSGVPEARAQAVGSILWLYLEGGEFPRTSGAVSLKAVERFKAIYGELLERGYYLPPSAYEVLFLSTAHTSQEVQGLAEAVVEALSGVGAE